MSEYTNVYSSNNGLTFNEYLSKVFSAVAIGVGITAVISFGISHFFMDAILAKFAGEFATFGLACILVEFGVAIFFAARLNKMSKTTAWVCYILYSVCTGISLSFVLYAYTETSVYITFIVSCIMFATLSFIGHNTKVDLSKFSGIIMPGLIAIILVSLLNVFFFKNQMIQWGINYLGVILFLFLIAYDMQRLRDLYAASFNDSQMGEKLMIYGAFQLYLDFINLFIRLLQLFGKLKNDND